MSWKFKQKEIALNLGAREPKVSVAGFSARDSFFSMFEVSEKRTLLFAFFLSLSFIASGCIQLAHDYLADHDYDHDHGHESECSICLSDITTPAVGEITVYKVVKHSAEIQIYRPTVILLFSFEQYESRAPPTLV